MQIERVREGSLSSEAAGHYMQPHVAPGAQRRLSGSPGDDHSDAGPLTSLSDAIIPDGRRGGSPPGHQLLAGGQDCLRVGSFAFASADASTRSVFTDGALAKWRQTGGSVEAADASAQPRTLQQLKHLRHLQALSSAPAHLGERPALSAGPELQLWHSSPSLPPLRPRSPSPPQGHQPSLPVRSADSGRSGEGRHHNSSPVLRPVAVRPGDARSTQSAASCPPTRSSPVSGCAPAAAEPRTHGSAPGSLAASSHTASPETCVGCGNQQPGNHSGAAFDIVRSSSVSSAALCTIVAPPPPPQQQQQQQQQQAGGSVAAGMRGCLGPRSPSQGSRLGSPQPEDLQMPTPAFR